MQRAALTSGRVAFILFLPHSTTIPLTPPTELITLSFGSLSPFSLYMGVLIREYVPLHLPFAVCHPPPLMRILGHLRRSVFMFYFYWLYCFYCRLRICLHSSIYGLIHSNSYLYRCCVIDRSYHGGGRSSESLTTYCSTLDFLARRTFETALIPILAFGGFLSKTTQRCNVLNEV